VNDADQFDQLVGRVFEKRYRILEPLGEGGMGAVFLGEHVVIGRKVAIKVLHSRLGASEDFASRFAREAVAAGRLAHPNCVPVTDSGQLEDGTAYLVMELVKGISLGTLLEDEGPALDPIRALRIARDVLRGLGHAHKMGIVHRDVKPDNVMLTERDDNPDFARVLDFGIAKLRDDDNKEGETLTKAGMSVGTPSYLSPEQALGDEVDHRSDLYSCAVLIFEMLTGRPPFTAPNPVGILTKHASAPVPHIWDIEPSLTDQTELDDLVQRGLAKIRDERFKDAAEFIESINTVMLALGANVTPLPVTGDFAAISPVEQVGATRALTGPFAPDPVPEDTGDVPFYVEQTAVTPPMRRPAKFTLGAREGLIATVLVALLGSVLWMATGKDNKAEATFPGIDKDALLAEYTTALRKGKTCPDRLAAVEKLALLGDPRAIPNLKKANRRMRGGTLGFGAKNTNRCLKKAAKEAIRTIKATSR
jgi:serine/threonine protein kinase